MATKRYTKEDLGNLNWNGVIDGKKVVSGAGDYQTVKRANLEAWKVWARMDIGLGVDTLAYLVKNGFVPSDFGY